MKHKFNPLMHHIRFKVSDGLNITVETERLLMRSISADDKNDCTALFGDPLVMEKFEKGVPWESEQLTPRLQTWINCWKDHNPFSGYSIFDKKSNEFMGLIVIEYSAPGEAEVFYLFHHRFWGKGYGTEATSALLRSLVPQLMLQGYTIDHIPLKKVVATARLDNPASEKVLKRVGFKEEEKVHKFGAWRLFLSIFAKQLRNDYQKFFTQRDQKLHQKKQLKLEKEGVSVTAEEMAASAFGQQSNAARKLHRK